MTTLGQGMHPNGGMALWADGAPRDRSDASTPRSFRLTRVPDGAGTQLQRLPALAIVQFTVVLLILPLDATDPIWLRVALAAGVTVATGAALLQYVEVVRLDLSKPVPCLLDTFPAFAWVSNSHESFDLEGRALIPLVRI